MSEWLALLIQALPAIENAINAIVNATGKSKEQAMAELVDHITPGQPNSPTLTN